MYSILQIDTIDNKIDHLVTGNPIIMKLTDYMYCSVEKSFDHLLCRKELTHYVSNIK